MDENVAPPISYVMDEPNIQEGQRIPIAVVDDNEQTLYTVSRYLRRAGFEVWEGKTGADALRLASNQPELIILDVKLPDMIGYEVCRQIKSNPATASIPVLHTSATFLDTQHKVAGLEGGADGYLAAPIKPEELIATVRALLRVRAAERKAEAIAKQWQTTFDAISSGICLLDRHGRVERCNACFSELVGRPLSEIVQRTFDEVAGWASIRTLPYQRMLETHHREIMETQVGERWWRMIVDPVWSDREELTGAVCVVSDITERKRSETQLQRSERNLADFFENASIALNWTGPDGTILRANQAELDLLGYTREEYIGRNIAEFHVSQQVIEDMCARLRRGESMQNYEARLRCKDGSVKDVLISKNVLWEEGQFVHTRCFTRDVTLQKGAESRLRAQYQVTSVLVEASTLKEAAQPILKAICASTGWRFGAFWRIDREQNQAACVGIWRDPAIEAPDFEEATRQLKITPGDSLPGDTWQKRRPVWLPDITREASFQFPRAPIAAREGFRAALAVPICFGEEVIGIFEFFSDEIRQPDPEVLQMLETMGSQIGLFMERRYAEESLAAAQAELRRHADELEKRVAERTARLEESNRSLESFCYSIAHDLRAPVRAMQGFAGALLEDYASHFDDEGRDYANRIVSAGTRMDSMIRDLLSYGRLSHMDLPRSWVEPARLLQSIRDERDEEIQRKKAQMTFETEIKRLWTNPIALEQILSNLVSNSLKFSRPDAPPLIHVKIEDLGCTLRVSVRDNGIGIAPQYLSRIFNVFERLHEGQTIPGTGIGLALVQKAAERLGGELGVESEPGQGSCFRVDLPKEPCPTN